MMLTIVFSIMEHTKRIEMISGIYSKLVSNRIYNDKLMKETGIDKRCIETRKQIAIFS